MPEEKKLQRYSKSDFHLRRGMVDKSLFKSKFTNDPFELVRSRCHRSKVMEDAYEQTRSVE